MKYTKPYKTFADQVVIWQQRGLIVDDPKSAEKIFSRLNYYRLSAYALPFQLKKDIFNSGTKWEDIINLYEFDRKLRLKLLGCLETIEVAFRTAICHYMALKFGSFGYVDNSNFNPKFKHASWYKNFNKELNRSTETFVLHYKAKYKKSKHFPIWMAAETMTFGSISKLYQGLNFADQKAISKIYNIPAPVLESWLHFFTYVRNLCAHHARVWNRELAIRPKYPFKINKFDSIRNDRIVCFFVIVDYLFNCLDVKNNVFDDFKEILEKHTNIKIDHMGFDKKLSSY